MPHNYKRSFRDLNDGIIEGRVLENMGVCQVCSTEKQLVLQIDKVTLPLVGVTRKKKGKRMKPHHTLLLYRMGPQLTTDPEPQPLEIVPVLFIGLSCGCYAKAHRQLARIDQRVKDKQ